MQENTYTTKEQFVLNELAALVKAIDKEISELEYKVDEHNEEFVNIFFENGYCKSICVSADSLSAMTSDVVRKL